MSSATDHPGGTGSSDDERLEDVTPSKDEMRDDDTMDGGDEAKDAMKKTMADQAKKAGDGTDDKEEQGLNPDG